MSFRTSDRLENAATAELLRAAEKLEAVNERNLSLQERTTSLEAELVEAKGFEDNARQLQVENGALHEELEKAYRLVAELKREKKIKAKVAAAAAGAAAVAAISSSCSDRDVAGAGRHVIGGLRE